MPAVWNAYSRFRNGWTNDVDSVQTGGEFLIRSFF